MSASFTPQSLTNCSSFPEFSGGGANFFKFQSQIYLMTVFKNALATYVLEEYNVSLGMTNKKRNFWSFISIRSLLSNTLQVFWSSEVAWSYKHETYVNIRQRKAKYLSKLFLWNPVPFCKCYLWGNDIFAFYYQWPQ